ncbi:Alpha/beta hydrolase fold-3 [Penicillium cf. griseofulvum]|uniref:Alpha/beta hydrolase fold-3 n=1 Tax=Penicillium cf. griseofulvum TaxID=2972120 RepID=A0A9W9T636_9EURO|nr:Alpha/beta hydrolase fold-3 [Penicillium cf. griseofulvum]KAJ5422208.1 Alpha/beta hydrolase fold-3 [Penicillium cf. griseofulvum]KAJ5428393.1 Alpha/beta hydrolase fold-3 [Penicillium cf. griseofulvum]
MGTIMYYYNKCFAFIIRTFMGFRRNVSANPDEIRDIQSRDAARTIKVHLYRPSTSGTTPVLINFHGSGFVLPLHGGDDEFCRRVSHETKHTVLDVRYRLAPEHPFPAALNDVEDAIKYVFARPDEFDLSRVSISGFSAGSNLGLAAASNLFPRDTFRCLIAIYPVTDLSPDPGAKIAPARADFVIPVPVMRLFDRCYIPPSLDRRDPRISPLYSQMDRFPRRVLMITADGDTLAPEGEALAQKIKQLPGWHVISERMQGCSHGWDKNTRVGTPQYQAKERAYQLAFDMLSGSS